MKLSKVKVKTYLFILAMLFACSRGLFELLVGKSFAFIFQVGGIILCLLPMQRFRFILKHYKSKYSIWAMSGVIFFSILSAIATTFNYGYIGAQYFIIIIFTFYIIFAAYSIILTDSVNFKTVFQSLIGIGFLITSVAILQQLRLQILELPGATADFGLIRPQSITGSFLHYPLVLAVICGVVFVSLMDRGGVKKLIVFFFFLACLLSTISRSGMVIVFCIMGYYFVTKINMRTILTLLSAVAIVTILIPIFPIEMAIISDRIFGATSADSAGNDGRFEIWKTVFANLNLSTIFFGTNFGLITNSAPPEFIKGIAESSVLQQILNLGLIGTLLYYLTWFELRHLISANYRIVLLACIFQTTFYQSIEVIPFLFFALMIPVFTNKLQSTTKNNEKLEFS